MQPAQCVLLFLVLAGNSTLFQFYIYIVACSYSSRRFLCALVLLYRPIIIICSHMCTHSPLTHAPPVPAIPPPSSVKLEFINISAVLVSWSYPFEDVPPPIQFLLQCSKDGRPYQNVTKLMNSTQFVFGHMLLSAYYQFRVTAYRRGVASHPSQPSYSFLNGITGEAVHGDSYRKTVKRVGSCQSRFL